MNGDNGGPDYPSSNKLRVGDLVSNGHTGMSLRDYFAAKAVAGYLAHDGEGFDTIQEAANFCYKLADAMLKARQQ